MKTVKELIEELRKFPEDAQCYAYEGEVTGVVVKVSEVDLGVIHCGHGSEKEPETERFREGSKV